VVPFGSGPRPAPVGGERSSRLGKYRRTRPLGFSLIAHMPQGPATRQLKPAALVPYQPSLFQHCGYRVRSSALLTPVGVVRHPHRLSDGPDISIAPTGTCVVFFGAAL